MNIIKFHKRISTLAQSLSLPETHQFDVETDLSILKGYGEVNYIWVLRTEGTTLLPLKLGVNPLSLTKWFNNKDRIFFLNVKDDIVTEINEEKAASLINEKPLNIDEWPDDIDSLDRKVKAVLGYRHWGIFLTPDYPLDDWGVWLGYFRTTKNQLMSNFIEKALDHKCRLSTRNQVA
jgi:hypothetical protein